MKTKKIKSEENEKIQNITVSYVGVSLLLLDDTRSTEPFHWIWKDEIAAVSWYFLNFVMNTSDKYSKMNNSKKGMRVATFDANWFPFSFALRINQFVAFSICKCHIIHELNVYTHYGECMDSCCCCIFIAHAHYNHPSPNNVNSVWFRFQLNDSHIH